jgi:hypothetical protein
MKREQGGENKLRSLARSATPSHEVKNRRVEIRVLGGC